MIHRVKKYDGTWVENDADIATEAVAYFTSLFSGEATSQSDRLLNLIPSLITEEDNLVLEEVPTMEEIRRVVFSMG